MATNPNDPVRSIITRQIYLNRYSNNVSNRILAILNNAYLDAVEQLRAIDLGQSTTSANSYHAQRLRGFMLQTRQTIATATAQAEGILIPALQGVTEAQTEFIQRQLGLAIEGGVIDGRTIGQTLSADTIPSSVVVNTVEVPPNFAREIATRDPNDIPLILQRDKAQTLANAVADTPVTVNLRTPLGTELARTMDNVPIVKRFRAITEGSADLFDRQVRIGLMQGETTDQISRRLVGKVQYSENRTFLGKGSAIEAKNTQVKTLVRTSVQSVTNAANQAVYQANQHVTKGYRYLATLDSRTSAPCRALDRKVFNYGEGPVPPIHFNCLTEDTFVSPIGRVAAVFKRHYEGVVYRFTTTRNNCFTCTPNHPILTGRGWVAAKFVKEGDEVICYFGDKLEPPKEGQNDQLKTTIKDFSRSFGKSSGVFTCEVPTTTPDFHGDGINGEVAVIAVNGDLLRQVNPSLCHQLEKHFFKPTIPAIAFKLASLCNSDSGFLGGRLSPCRCVGFLRQFNSFLFGGSLHSCRLLLRSVSCFMSNILKHSLNDVGRYFELICDAPNPDTICVKGFNQGNIQPGLSLCFAIDSPLLSPTPFFDPIKLEYHVQRRFSDPEFNANTVSGSAIDIFADDMRNVELGADRGVSLLGFIPDGNTIRDQYLSDGHWGNSNDVGNVFEALPTGVELDYVIAVECVEYSGHVYNLETEQGIYCADSIVTHNCRSTTVPYINYEALGIPAPATGKRASAGGTVAADLSYEDWLKQQPAGTVQRILGKGKGKLFLEGKVTLSEMVRSDGREVTLAELQRLAD